MIDIHSHVLPGIDDGCRDVEESIQVLKELKRQGVDVLVLTPHFYAESNRLERFLAKREKAFLKIKEQFQKIGIVPLLGAEVKYFPGISKTDLAPLKIQGTNMVLIEMPFNNWDYQAIEEVLEISRKYKVVLAHIERYFGYKLPKDIWDTFKRHGILFQINCSSLLTMKHRRKVVGMIKEGSISFMASDCHRIDTRPPKFDQALQYIYKKLTVEEQKIFFSRWSSDFVKNTKNPAKWLPKKATRSQKISRNPEKREIKGNISKPFLRPCKVSPAS